MRIAVSIVLAGALAIAAQQAKAQDRLRGGQGTELVQAQSDDQQYRQGKGRGHGQGGGRGRGQGRQIEQQSPEQAEPVERQPQQPRAGDAQEGGHNLVERANAAFHRNRYIQAERLYRRLLELREQRGGEGGPPLALVLNRLGYSIGEQGRYREAEPLLRRALAASEQDSGGEGTQVAVSLTSLGHVLVQQGRIVEAEPLLRRALALRERQSPDSPDLAVTLNNLAMVLRTQQRYADAEALLRRALAIREAKLGPEHPSVGMTLNSLSMAVRAQGRIAEAVALTERSVSIQEKHLGPRNPRLAAALNAQGMVKLAARDFAGAEAQFRRAVEIRDFSLGPQHPLTAQALGNLAFALARQDRAGDALAAIRRATEIQRARRDDDEQRYDEGAESERRTARWLFQRHVGIAYLAWRGAPPERKDALMAEAFEMAQWAQAGGVAGALARMSARFATGTGELARLVRERQDALTRRQALDRSLIEALSKTPQERDAEEEKATRAEVAELDKRLAALDQSINRAFPGYAELASARPLPLARVRQLVGPDEAMLLYLIREDDAFVWVVRRDRVLWRRLAGAREAYDASVKSLRATLDPAENRAMAPMPLELAHKLYRELVGPGEAALAGARHLIVVPDGPLQSLPFNVLVTTAPKSGAAPGPDYRAVDWLPRKYAVSVLPSVSSLQALRVMAATKARREAFAGFGDPALTGHGEPGAGSGQAKAHRGFVSESQFLQQLEPLPESARELAELARHLHAPAGRVWTQEEATETKVKTTDLSRFRVLAFATHGLMAGEFLDFAEPSLVLTPPAVGTPEDDGLLSASEVAQLRLDADWVILSACNTAAPDATPGAEGLSGLAKAFFYAGARSLLVSNWYVASDAAVKLTTGAVAAMDDAPGIGRAEALRRAMLALLDGPATSAEMTHPMFWAPFALVGEGGAGR